MAPRESVDPDASLWEWLAYDLRFYREKHGLSLSQVGQHIKAARSTVSNFEAGRRRIDEGRARVLDQLWDTGGHFRRLIMYAEAGHDPDWFRQHVQYEVKASEMSIFEPLAVPGLLQTEQYARATLSTGLVSDIETTLQERMIRQEILRRQSPPRLWVLITECALQMPVGGHEVMRGQLERLLEAADEPNIVLRVVPMGAGAQPGMDGCFKLMNVEGSEVGYVEAPEGGRLVRGGRDVERFALRYKIIGAAALPVGASKSLLAASMEAMR